MSSGLWARINLLSKIPINTREATLRHELLEPLAAVRRCLCGLPWLSATLPSASGNASVRGKGRSPPQKSLIREPSFSPECGHRAVSRKEVARAFFLLRRMQSGSTRVLFLTKGHKNRRQHSRSTGKCFMLTHSIEDQRLLPARPNLRHLKDQAIDLLRAGEVGSLTSAQFQIARRYGFASWQKLKYHVEAFQRSGRA
jgi:hypothetical protein